MKFPATLPPPVHIGARFRALPSMRSSSDDIERILRSRGVIAPREHPELRGAIDWRVRTGHLKPMLPGVYAAAAAATSTPTRIAAVARWDPDAVLTHEAAASVSFWPEVPVPVVRCAVRHHRQPQPGYEFRRSRIPSELVWQYGPLNVTAPALTALDLCERLGGAAIDQALLSRSTTLDLMRQALALTSKRLGNPVRRELLLDSRDEPWSEAERDLHRLLRAEKIKGWKANEPIRVDGRKVYADIVFRRLRLIVEVDGWDFHRRRPVFEADRKRQNLLVLDGWRVLRVTAVMIRDEPQLVIDTIRRGLTMCEAAA